MPPVPRKAKKTATPAITSLHDAVAIDFSKINYAAFEEAVKQAVKQLGIPKARVTGRATSGEPNATESTAAEKGEPTKNGWTTEERSKFYTAYGFDPARYRKEDFYRQLYTPKDSIKGSAY